MRITHLLTSVALLLGLALPGTVQSQDSGSELELPPRPIAVPHQDPNEVWELHRPQFLNATGELSAMIGTEYLRVRALRPELRLVWNRKTGRMEILGGKNLAAENATKIELELAQGRGGWEIARGRVLLEGRVYPVQSGTVTVETDAESGKVKGSFTLVAKIPGRHGDKVEVKNGRFDLRPAG